MMSSSDEEDDQDEEELLQRALAEQSQRDIRYSRPPNYPPPAISQTAAGPPARKPPVAPSQKPPQKPSPNLAQMEFDEESEEEMLSISSDDEAGAAKAGAQRQSELGIEDFSDDEEAEEEEPTSWKKVNEEELSRRVRDMREAKTLPAARLRKGMPLGRKSTMIGDAYRGGEDLIDPLGIGMIDVKTLSLQSDDSPQEKKADDHPVVRDHAIREKVMYHSEKFDPKFFLARVHAKTSARDLEGGELALKEDLQMRKQQLKLLVKENFECFVSCKNTIDDIHSKLQQIEADPEGAGTVHLTNAIQDVDDVARRAFGPLLERQAQAERIRSVQGMLQRFRTLFNLPSAIRANISKGEYDMAVREYKKTKSLVLPSHGGILKRVFEEVEKVAQELKEMLYRSMEDPHAEISQLENAIRLLLELEPDSDPIWHYLNIQERRIRGLLEGCVFEHEGHIEALHGRVREKAQSDARWKQLQTESRRSSEANIFLSAVDETEIDMKDVIGDESDALFGRLIRRLTTVIIRYVPDFWRLAISIFNGKFAKVSQRNKGSTIVQNNSEPYPFEDKVIELKYTAHSVEEVISMVQGVISSYEAKVHAAFMALSEATVMRSYMRDALVEISKACNAFEGKDCAPPVTVQALMELRMDLTREFIFRLCALMREKIIELVNEKDWVPVPAVERNGSPYTISALPLKFRDLLSSTIEHMAEMIENLKGESTLEAQVSQLQESLKSTFSECFLDFSELLHKIVIDISQAEVNANSSPKEEDTFLGLQMGLKITNPHQKLLLILSNVAYCKSVLLGQLSSNYSHVWSSHERSNSETESEVADFLSALEEKILNHYNYLKATTVGTAAAAYILDDGTQWASAPPVKGIRDAVVELLHPLVAVHAEVYAGAKPFLEKVICVLFEGLLDALVNTVSGNKSKALKHLDSNGYLQLMLELDYVETAVEVYCTSTSRASLKLVREILIERAMETCGDSADDHQRGPSSPNALRARAHEVKNQLLGFELKRTRINIICFIENPEKGSELTRPSPPPPSVGGGGGGGGGGRHRRMRSSGGSSASESNINSYGGGNSDVGSECDNDVLGRGVQRFGRQANEGRVMNSRRTSNTFHDDDDD